MAGEPGFTKEASELGSKREIASEVPSMSRRPWRRILTVIALLIGMDTIRRPAIIDRVPMAYVFSTLAARAA